MARLQIRAVATNGVGPIDLTIEAGECVALTGPSGAGKTLLLRALADLDPHAGEVWLGDRAASEVPAPEWRRRVGMLPAESAWWHDRVGPHLPADHTEVGPYLTALGLAGDVLSRDVARLSAGERQRLALIRLLANQPQALLLDEPTAHLDPDATRAVEQLVTHYRARVDAAVLWVSHDMAQAERVGDRTAHLVAGRVAGAP